MPSVLPGNFSPASVRAGPPGPRIGIRPNRNSEGIFATNEERVEGEGDGEAAGSEDNANEINPGREDVEVIRTNWIPAFPGEYGEYSDEEAEDPLGNS